MKKIVLGIMFLGMIVGCKKENTTVQPEEQSAEQPQTNTESAPIVEFKKVEYSPEETSKYLAKQNNDTLYVNNFFATWCGPCIREIPHFKEKMNELKGQPVKFTFINLDAKEDWDGAVKDFAEEHGLSNHIVLLDGSKITADFFPKNFKQWDGGAIPFTFMRKGDKTDETLGMMSAEMLDQKIQSFK